MIPTETLPTNDAIVSLLIPIAERLLILPTISVAEILLYKNARILTQKLPDKRYNNWLLGIIEWRGFNVPMISFEAINGGTIPTTTPVSQIAVLNSTGIKPKLPFLSFPTKGIPTISEVFPENIGEDKTLSRKSYDEMNVKINDISATIPNIIKLEHAIVDLLNL